MANTAQVLPRFLLPKLSWQSVTVRQNAIRTLSYVSTSNAQARDLRKNRASNATSKHLNQLSLSSLSASPILRKLPQRRAFHATPTRPRDHHFDTLKFVQRLKEEGFTEAQAVAMMKVLSDVIEERYAQRNEISNFN